MRQAKRFAPRTVVFLGAGVSTCAGYPVGSNLLTSLRTEVESTSLLNLKTAWRKWKEFTENAQAALEKGDTLARLLLNSNPEIALSSIDLMESLLEWEDADAQRAGFAKAADDVQAGVGMLQDYFQGERREALSAARAARESLVHSLDWYFSLRHAALRNSPSSSRDFLRTVLQGEGFEAGDAIITTNWDAVPELTLGEDGLWNPFDGYGFNRVLVNGFSRPNGRPAPLPKGLPRSSKVKVLKLHGSFGWREAHERVYLDYQEFLYDLPFRYGSELVTFRDTAAPEFPSSGSSILLYPSFLKRLRTLELYQVWHLAGEALRAARKVVVVGYSLPDADTAVRTLLLPLRFRAMNADVEVVVIDKSDQTLQRWQDFLQGNAQEHRMSVCDDATSLESPRKP